jgi:aflatoxin B1 aldehyde reductase
MNVPTCILAYFLTLSQVDILYVHAPEVQTPFEEQLDALNELFKQGAFKRLGISNFSAEQVQEFYDIAKKNGYPLPAVYQGNYSAVARKVEESILPTLRKLGISYYAYSPIAGGLLAKTRKQVEEGVGRFNPDTDVGKLYNTLYHRPAYLDFLDKWGNLADEAGISKAELAYRWAVFHSALDGEKGDGLIFGARTPEQIKQTFGYIQAGPLPGDVANRVSGLWDSIKNDAILDNFNQ